MKADILILPQQKNRKLNKRISVSVIGDSGVSFDSALYHLAFRLGKKLADLDYRIINGGMSGIMEACCKGARSSANYKEGMLVSIVPGFDPSLANSFADIIIPTGLDAYRNGIIANSEVVVAIGGGAGTLSEIALAWTFKRMLIAYDVPGWSGKVADTRIDERKRIPWENDKVFKVRNEDEVAAFIEKYVHHYHQRHQSITGTTSSD